MCTIRISNLYVIYNANLFSDSEVWFLTREGSTL